MNHSYSKNEILKAYISNYQLNIFDYHDYSNFENFSTELKTVFGFLRYAKDKEKLRKLVAQQPENYYNVTDETYQIIAELTRSEELLKNKDRYGNPEGGRNMCKALEDIKQEGREEGREEGVQALIKTCQELKVSYEVTMSKVQDNFQMDDETAKEYMDKYWKI